ncbi:hypothetical protein [Pectinatus frisingensis]|uniref:hypothetical protein n=1 Tax=Pectinatus frisingensis TaxID=865 RepID=UPI003D802F80
MFGYNNNNNNYGPMNALADILGAYWQKQDELGALKDINNINFPDPNQGQQTLSRAAQNYSQPTQAQLTAIAPAPASEIQSNPIDKAIAQNVNGNVTAPMGQITGTPNGLNGSILQAAQNYVQDTGASTPPADAFSNGINQQQSQYDQQQKAMQKAALQKQYDDFAAAKAANPQWYVGDTYVGDDANAKQAALQSQAQKQAQDIATQFSDANHSVSDNLKTYEQYASQVTQMKANIMYKIAQKYGVDALQTIEPLIDKTIQGKLSGLAQSLDLQNRNVLMPLLDYAGTQTGNLRALESMVNYNNAAKQMGLTGIDQNDANNLINSFANNISKVDTGGDVKFVATPKNGIAYDNGQLLTTAGTLQKSITPDTDAKLKVDVWKWINPSGNQKLASQTQLQVTQMNNSAKTYIAQMQNAIEQGKLSAENKNSVIASCKEIVNAAGVDAGTKQGALNVLKIVGGVPDPAGWIDEAKNRGYSHDQIISKLHQQGYGDSYDSWVPDD